MKGFFYPKGLFRKLIQEMIVYLREYELYQITPLSAKVHFFLNSSNRGFSSHKTIAILAAKNLFASRMFLLVAGRCDLYWLPFEIAGYPRHSSALLLRETGLE